MLIRYMTPMAFSARWDKTLRISTLLIGALILSLMVFLPSATWWQWAIKLGVPLLIVGAAAWAPRSFRIESDALIVSRFIGSVRIPLAGLRKARLMDPAELRGAVRIWAVGGFCGYYGKFLSGFESQTWYVTDRQSCVRLDCDAGIVVISPSDPEACLAALARLRAGSDKITA